MIVSTKLASSNRTSESPQFVVLVLGQRSSSLFGFVWVQLKITSVVEKTGIGSCNQGPAFVVLVSDQCTITSVVEKTGIGSRNQTGSQYPPIELVIATKLEMSYYCNDYVSEEDNSKPFAASLGQESECDKSCGYKSDWSSEEEAEWDSSNQAK